MKFCSTKFDTRALGTRPGEAPEVTPRQECFPSLEFIAASGRTLYPHYVTVGDAEREEDGGGRVADEGGIEIAQPPATGNRRRQ